MTPFQVCTLYTSNTVGPKLFTVQTKLLPFLSHLREVYDIDGTRGFLGKFRHMQIILTKRNSFSLFCTHPKQIDSKSIKNLKTSSSQIIRRGFFKMISPQYRSSNRQERDQGVRRGEGPRDQEGTGGQGRRVGSPFELTNVENWRIVKTEEGIRLDRRSSWSRLRNGKRARSGFLSQSTRLRALHKLARGGGGRKEEKGIEEEKGREEEEGGRERYKEEEFRISLQADGGKEKKS